MGRSALRALGLPGRPLIGPVARLLFRAPAAALLTADDGILSLPALPPPLVVRARVPRSLVCTKLRDRLLFPIKLPRVCLHVFSARMHAGQGLFDCGH